MLDIALPTIRRAIAQRRPGYMLDADFYTDPGIYRTDLDVIFGRHWIFVGVEPDVPEPGDVMTVTVGNASVLIARDDDGSIHAHHNICRHRAARLVTAEKTTVSRLVCPYHAWTYGIDGQLLHAPHMQPGFDRGCHGLRRVHLRSLAGLLFVCLADDPPADFDDMAGIVTPYIAPHDIANCKVAHQVDMIEEGNWKITMENNRECYHCSLNHPELTASLFEYAFSFNTTDDDPHTIAQRRQYDSMVEALETRCAAQGLPAREVARLDDRITAFRIGRVPMDQAGESQTMDARVACRKLLGTLQDKKLGALSFHTQPNSWHHFMSDHIVTFSALPLSPERTLVRTKWLVRKDAVEGSDYDLENLTHVWRETNAEDGRLVGLAQSGVVSPGYVPGPYSEETEEPVEKFDQWYIGRLDACCP